MNEVHYPQNLNRYDETIALCGEKIPKVKVHEYSNRKKSDPSRVTQAIDKVNCKECLQARYIQIGNMSHAVFKRRHELGYLE